MNVLELLHAAADLCGIARPSSYSSNRQLLAQLVAVARQLRQTRAFPQQKRNYEFSTEANRSKYPHPEDFYAGLLGTRFDQSRNWELVGPVDDPMWNYNLYGPGGSTQRLEFRVFGPDLNQATAGGNFELFPTPSSVITISYDYISKNLFLPPNWEEGESGITVGKYRNANGNIYKASAITTGITSTVPPDHTTGTDLDGGVTWLYISAPYEKPLTDEDLCLFDDDVMLDGVEARWKGGKNQNSGPAEARFNGGIGNASARFEGSVRGSMSRRGRARRRYSHNQGDGGWNY